VVGRALRWRPYGNRQVSKFKARYALSGRLYSVLLRVYFVSLRKFLLHGFGAFELLQKSVVAPRDGFLHRFFIGTPQLLSDCFSNGLERNNGMVWHLSHLDQCLKSNIVPERTLVSKNFPLYLRPVRMIVLSFRLPFRRAAVHGRGRCGISDRMAVAATWEMAELGNKNPGR
jgi:hypothetical protein